jgi:release factor glutamine methyltransferase
VNRSTLIPRPETEHLVEAALKLTENRGRLDILDLGTGSGAIAIAMAKERPEDRITATDISSDALLTAMENSRANHLDDIRFIQSDWFSALAGIMFDLILCNPPYVESNDPGFSYGEIRYEPRIALDGGLGGIGAYLRIIPAAIKHLNHGGYLVLEHGHTQSGVIRQLLEDHHYGKISTYSDHSGQDRVSFAEVSH